MKKLNEFYSYGHSREESLMHVGSGRRLPPTPVAPTLISSLTQTAPATANSSPRTTKSTNNSKQGKQSSAEDLELTSINYFNSSNRRSLLQGKKLDHRQSHSSTPHIFTGKSVISMHQPLRSQSFKHRPRAVVNVKRHQSDETTQQMKERRRSTPNIFRCSTQYQRHRPLDTARTDVWPKPKTSMVEERFLSLVDPEDYTRVREFNIDEKGTVVSRGDSFRLKSPTSHKREPPQKTDRSVFSNDSNSSNSTLSNSIVPISNDKDEDNQPSTSTAFYKIYVLGSTGVGKTALIGQFMTSDHRNTYATDIEQVDNTVSIIIGNRESELTFYEVDPHNDKSWLDSKADIYLLVYSIDSKSSFKQVMYAVERLRQSTSTRNKPIVMAANKVDLERKRAVSKTDAKNAAMTYGFAHYEVTVALNLNVDDLLVGLIAEIKESLKSDLLDFLDDVKSSKENTDMTAIEEPSEFKAAIRRYSKRRQQEMGGTTRKETNKCTHFKSNLVERLRSWRRLLPNLHH